MRVTTSVPVVAFIVILNAFTAKASSSFVSAFCATLIALAYVWFSKFRQKRIPPVLLYALSFVLGLTWFLYVKTEPVSDFRQFFDEAVSLSHGFNVFGTISTTKSPTLALAYAPIFAIFGANSLTAGIFSVAIGSFQPVLLGKILDKFGIETRVTNAVSIAFVVFPPSFIFAGVMGSDNLANTLALCTILVSSSLILKTGISTFRVFLLGILAGATYFARQNIGIAVLVLVAVLIFSSVGRSLSRAKAVYTWVFFTLPTLLMTGFYFLITSLTAPPGAISPNRMASWIFATGTNRESQGGYSSSDWASLGYPSATDAEAIANANERALDLALNRVFSDVPGFFDFATGPKMQRLWGGSSDFFYWSFSGQSGIASPVLVNALQGLAQSMELVLIATFLFFVAAFVLKKYVLSGPHLIFFRALLLSLITLLVPMYFLEVQHRYRSFAWSLMTLAIALFLGRSKQEKLISSKN